MELVIIFYLYIVGTIPSLLCTKALLNRRGFEPDLVILILFGLLWPLSFPIGTIVGWSKSQPR
jgi:hypothetical protein